ncbi:hypothetical protein T10_9929, partial [Trichinella papuae]
LRIDDDEAGSINLKNAKRGPRWIARGLKIPTTEKGMKQMVMPFGEEIIPEIKKRLKEEKDSGRKFSLSLDEWTSCGNKQYLCLNVYTIILEKFEQFELDMKSDIVALVMDSAFVMKTIGRLLGIEHQLRYNHGIHLAVADVIYCVMGDVVKKVRKIVAFFQRSTVINDCLQKMCDDMLGKNLALIMDSRVRWNSMLAMLRRFLEMKHCVKSDLKGLSDFDNFLSETEQTLISDILNALEPVAVCVNALGRNDCSLATALKQSVLQNISKQSSGIAKKMFKIHVEETEYDDGNGDDSEKSDPDINKSIADQLDTLIRRRKYFKCDLIDSCPGKDIMKIIKNEMAVFEAIGQLPKTLQMLYDALITVPSTSWEAERSFSAAGLFVTKLRSSLKDETIDTLCLLRSYHMQS